MAKGRVLKKSEARDRDVNALSNPWAIVGWHRLIASSDDDGRGLADPSLLKLALFPYNREIDTEAVLRIEDEWVKRGLVTVYQDGDNLLYQILKWHRHQTIRRDRRTPSDFPPPQGFELREDEWQPRDNHVTTTCQPQHELELELEHERELAAADRLATRRLLGMSS